MATFASPRAGASIEDQLSYYKAQYEQISLDLQDFQASSKELEAELEKDVEASEKRERKLREQTNLLESQVEEWKTKCRQSREESNRAQHALQKEVTSMRETNRTLQMRLRDIEVANDDYERQARSTTTSLEDLESKHNVETERAVLLETELKISEQEREGLRIETQRLRDELSDLKVESDILAEKLRKSQEAAQQNGHKRQPLHVNPARPRSEVSVGAASPGDSSDPASAVGEAYTPPSPPLSDVNSYAQAGKPQRPLGSHARRLNANRLPSTTSTSTRRSQARESTDGESIPRSVSLAHVRRLIDSLKREVNARPKRTRPSETSREDAFPEDIPSSTRRAHRPASPDIVEESSAVADGLPDLDTERVTVRSPRKRSGDQALLDVPHPSSANSVEPDPTPIDMETPADKQTLLANAETNAIQAEPNTTQLEGGNTLVEQNTPIEKPQSPKKRGPPLAFENNINKAMSGAGRPRQNSPMPRRVSSQASNGPESKDAMIGQGATAARANLTQKPSMGAPKPSSPLFQTHRRTSLPMNKPIPAQSTKPHTPTTGTTGPTNRRISTGVPRVPATGTPAKPRVSTGPTAAPNGTKTPGQYGPNTTPKAKHASKERTGIPAPSPTKLHDAKGDPTSFKSHSQAAGQGRQNENRPVAAPVVKQRHEPLTGTGSKRAPAQPPNHHKGGSRGHAGAERPERAAAAAGSGEEETF